MHTQILLVKLFFFKTGETALVTQRTYRLHFMLRRIDGSPERKSIRLSVEISIRNTIILRLHEISTKSSLGCNYRFTSLKKSFDSKRTMCTNPCHDLNKLYLIKNDKRFTIRSYHCHFPKFIWHIKMRVQNIGCISVALCKYLKSCNFVQNISIK